MPGIRQRREGAGEAEIGLLLHVLDPGRDGRRVREPEVLDRELKERDTGSTGLDGPDLEPGTDRGDHQPRKAGTRADVVGETVDRTHDGGGTEAVQDVPVADPCRIRGSDETQGNRPGPQECLERLETTGRFLVQPEAKARCGLAVGTACFT